MPDLDTSLEYCTYCPKLCRHVCPVSNAEARETLTPQHKMATMRLLRIGKTERDAASVAPLYGCSGCGACAEACRHHITPGRHLFTGRAEAVRAGAGHPALDGLPERVRAHAEVAAAAVRDLVPVERLLPEAEAALFPACDADPAATTTLLALLDRLGASWVAVADTPVGCGGYPLLAGGETTAFRLHAEALAQRLAGYSKVVVACPACAWTMKREYPAHGVPLRPEVVHVAEFLERFAERLPVAVPQPGAFYHDPCYLGRWLGVYDAPRRLLERALVDGGLREFSRARSESGCCGGGGLLPITMPETADAIAAERLGEVREAGVSQVVTACPTCRRRLSRDGVAARDLVEVLEAATRPA